jgi:hypothetical protein
MTEASLDGRHALSRLGTGRVDGWPIEKAGLPLWRSINPHAPAGDHRPGFLVLQVDVRQAAPDAPQVSWQKEPEQLMASQ